MPKQRDKLLVLVLWRGNVCLRCRLVWINHRDERGYRPVKHEHGRDEGTAQKGVVEFGGFLGIGTKYFAVPWTAFNVDTGEECLRLNVSKDRLDEADGFDKDNWPDMANMEWATRTHANYGQTPYWQ